MGDPSVYGDPLPVPLLSSFDSSFIQVQPSLQPTDRVPVLGVHQHTLLATAVPTRVTRVGRERDPRKQSTLYSVYRPYVAVTQRSYVRTLH